MPYVQQPTRGPDRRPVGVRRGGEIVELKQPDGVVAAEPLQAGRLRVVMRDPAGQQVSAPLGDVRRPYLVAKDADASLGAEIELEGGGGYCRWHVTQPGASGPRVALHA